jgi:CheY-like chemotaxis protein
MPLMNGFQLIEFIRKEDKNFKIPIIATTSNLTQDLLEEYQHLGIDFILQKPIDEELFCSKIETILEK